MTSIEAYKRFLLKINKNDTNTNIKVNKGEFVLIFNEQSRIWLADQIKRFSDTYEKNDVSSLLAYDKKLVRIKDNKEFSEFEFPEDYFDYESSFSIASRGKCKGRKLYNWDFKGKNRNVIDQDQNNNPSFDYEETIINPSENKLLVFKTDFEISEQYLTYFKEPANIDIKGYIKFDGSQSTDVDSDLGDYYVNQIINLCAVEVDVNYGNVEKFQLDKTKI